MSDERTTHFFLHECRLAEQRADARLDELRAFTLSLARRVKAGNVRPEQCHDMLIDKAVESDPHLNLGPVPHWFNVLGIVDEMANELTMELRRLG